MPKKKQKSSRQTNLSNILKSLRTNATYTQVDKNMIVGNKKIEDRIPLPDEDHVKVPNYIMNNRESFIKFANEILFKEYKDKIENETEESKITCDNLTNSSAKSELMIHQQLIRDYLNLITPYRGLLLYHGLGAGKTCGSIAIAEGMKNFKKVFILLPASLKRNYIEEIKKCGDPMFKKNQFWEWISTRETQDENLINNLSALLFLTVDEIKKQGGVWITDITKQSNIRSLDENQLQSLNRQLDLMISKKYTFIHYNGLRTEQFKTMTSGYTNNIFDNSVIIIDEAHNLISRIVNRISKIKKSKTTSTRTDELDDVLSLRMYHMLMSAENCKIILLSGTPIINYPNEIGILFNILRGYIKSWSFTLMPAPGTTTVINEKILRNNVFSKDKIVDYIKYTPTTKELIITRNPLGFSSVIKRSKYDDEGNIYEGVTNIPKQNSDGSFEERRMMNDEEFKRKIIDTLMKNNIRATFKTATYNLALPDTLDDFIANFIDSNNSGQIKNAMKLKRRIIGLTSYFRSAQEELMPRYDKKINKHVVQVPMSNYQFSKYVEYRKKERISEMNNAKSKAMNVGKDDIFKTQSSTYRIMSRLGCNLTLPNRPNPVDYKKKSKNENEESKNENAGEDDDEVIVIEPVKKSRKSTKTNARSQTQQPQQTQPIPSKIEEFLVREVPDLNDDAKTRVLSSINEFGNSELGMKYKNKLKETYDTRMSTYFKSYAKKIKDGSTNNSFSEYFNKLSLQSKSKKGGKKNKNKNMLNLFLFGGGESDDEDDIIEIQQPQPIDEPINVDDNIIMPDEENEENAEKAIQEMVNASYATDVEEFMRNLKQNPDAFLKIVEEPEDGTLDQLSLTNYSPKYVEIIKNITSDDHIGLHLLYSQFRNMEGLAIFSLALDVNGFSRFELSKNSNGMFEISRKTMNSMNDNELLYALYTGEETSDERELIRNIYNGDWNDVPQNIREQLLTKSSNNNFGEIIKLLMITSAGAEGINLRNTRYVHVMEPYWHPVRVEQVIGRAKRICSHKNLPEELRTVEVFIYISTFTKEQLSSEFAGEINQHDKSKNAPFKPQTSDEKLLEISDIKENISENLLRAVKETSIDCATYSNANEGKEGLTCLSFNNSSISNFAYVPNYEEQPQDNDIQLGQIQKTHIRKQLTLNTGEKYEIDTETNEIYDLGQFEPIGRMTNIDEIDKNTGKKIPSGRTTIQFYKSNK